MQSVLDDYFERFDTRRAHEGRGMNGRKSSRAFTGGIAKTSKTEVTGQTKNCQNQCALGPASNAVTVNWFS